MTSDNHRARFRPPTLQEVAAYTLFYCVLWGGLVWLVLEVLP
ncbi:hypothetical protein RAA17_16615 [Komagataeibacter rhaeticus]|nr:hypothetical protein [Komagataeibacter rhaeticus]